MGSDGIDREAERSQLVLLMTIRIVSDRGVAIIFFFPGVCNTGGSGKPEGRSQMALSKQVRNGRIG